MPFPYCLLFGDTHEKEKKRNIIHLELLDYTNVFTKNSSMN